jgi:polyisoprenoid-binding protein YceI
MRRRWIKWLIGGLVVVLLAVTLGPFIYIHFIEGDPPAKLEISSSPQSAEIVPESQKVGLAGAWVVGDGSQAGYRVNEVLFGQDNTAVGRTSSVTGGITISGTTVTKGEFRVDLTTVTSDSDRRDGQFQGRIMDTAEFPNATFKLTEPIKLDSVPADGKIVDVPATGDLTLHGTTKSVTVTLEAKRSGNTIEVSGSIPVAFADYGIPSPSFGSISVEDHGTIEFLLVMKPA